MFTPEAIDQLEMVIQTHDVTTVALTVNRMSIPVPIKTAVLFHLSRMKEPDIESLFGYLAGLVECLRENPETGFDDFLERFSFPPELKGLIHGLIHQQQ